MEHFNSCIELVEDDSSLFHNPTTVIPSKVPSDPTKFGVKPLDGCAKVIECLLDVE